MGRWAVVAEAEPVGRGRSGDSRARGAAGLGLERGRCGSGGRGEVLVEGRRVGRVGGGRGGRGGVLGGALGGGPPAERLARAAVERVGDGGGVFGAVARE